MSRAKVIITLVVAAVVAVWMVYPRLSALKKYEQGKYVAGIAGLKSLHMKVELYELEIGSLPKTLNDLVQAPAGVSAWHGPYAKPGDLVDPFGHAYEFRSPGEHSKFDLVYLGKDGRPGGSGVDADVGNWEVGDQLH